MKTERSLSCDKQSVPLVALSIAAYLVRVQGATTGGTIRHNTQNVYSQIITVCTAVRVGTREAHVKLSDDPSIGLNLPGAQTGASGAGPADSSTHEHTTPHRNATTVVKHTNVPHIDRSSTTTS